MNIYFLRHAQSEGNKERRFFGVTNTPLSKEGKQSLVTINRFFRQIPMDRIYCSPLERCMDTAGIVFGQAAKLVVDESLREVNFGDWEGKHFKDIIESYPDGWEQYQSDWKHFCFPNGDAIPAYQKTAQGTMARILKGTHEDEKIALVSHNGFIKAALSYVLAGDTSLTDRLSVQNATVNWVEILDGEPKLRLLNYLQRI